MKDLGGSLVPFLIGGALGAGALYAFQHMKSFNIGFETKQPAQASAGYMIQPGFTDNNPTWTTDEIGGATDVPEGQSGVWSFRDRKDRNDGILFNKLPHIPLNALSEFNPSKLNFIGTRDFDCTAPNP